MDTSEAAFEAEVELDGEALRRKQARRDPRGGERATQLSKGGVDTSASREGEAEEEEETGEASEASPLLPRSRENGNDERKPSSAGGVEDFSHLPWYKRPNIIWILFPFLLMALAFGGSIAPKINLILELVCREYISERQTMDPGFTMAPVNFMGGDNDQCRIPEVQSRVSIFTLWASLLGGILSALTAPKLGALSDRYGRKPILVFTSVGTICSEIFTIFAATYPETFPVDLLLVGFALDGLFGSFIVAMAIANSYAADCTPPQLRNVAFGYFHGCLFTGLAIGPIIAGYIVKWTGRIVLVFYILLAVHLFFILFIALACPESLSKPRQHAARDKHATALAKLGPAADWISWLRHLNLLEPLKILYPTGPHATPALRWNLIVLAAVDTIAFGVAMGSMTMLIIYTNYQFGWKTFESSRFMSIVNTSRVLCLIVILPLVTRLVRGKVDMKKRNTGCDTFDMSVIRIAILFDTLGYLGYTLARQGDVFILSGVVAALGGIASPTLQSALTKHVPAEQTGQLLGASGLLHALARVVAPTVFNAIYSATVGKFTQTVFVCLTSTFGLAFLLSWFIRPHVYLDPSDMHDSTSEEPAPAFESQGKSGIPIVSSITAAFGAVLAFLGLRSQQ
ncbi:hypothetical protein B0A55_01801 [Friedmanniomyces simplex]|uniref:Major facilitator superfamily (MFS) profile domain-containing protein n=1 Tax=Friedmanniomyces simplex TaxID=329884 RepID=A0A4U0Y5D4_9PEZI|nr:hypothetical protein B0A55_01801 [Friedmanniomyces simplex]